MRMFLEQIRIRKRIFSTEVGETKAVIDVLFVLNLIENNSKIDKSSLKRTSGPKHILLFKQEQEMANGDTNA